MGLKLLGGAVGAFSFAIKHPDVEGVETEGVQTGQFAVGVVPTKSQDLLLNMMRVVFVVAVLSPQVHLKHIVGLQ